LTQGVGIEPRVEPPFFARQLRKLHAVHAEGAGEVVHGAGAGGHGSHADPHRAGLSGGNAWACGIACAGGIAWRREFRGVHAAGDVGVSAAGPPGARV